MMFEVIKRVVHDTSGLFSQDDITDRPCLAITIGVNSLNASHYQVEYCRTDGPPVIVLKSDNPNGFVTGKEFSIDKPAPTLMAAGMGGDSLGHWHFIDDRRGMRVIRNNPKPIYCVPSMAEINALPKNGYKAISTFSGCGGSSLGYKMAGFKVLWASEFVPAAQDTYRANHPDTILDTKDIRNVKAADILSAIGMQTGELDLMDGSPPCASFSTAGKREAGWGQVKNYSDTKQRTDDLFFEYARLVKDIQPKVFVAENVSGLVKGTAKGYFLEILKALKDCGYTVEAKLLDAQWLGVPQMRQRIIFVGVRNDLNVKPAFPKPLPYQYSVRDAIPWIVSVPVVLKNFEDSSQSSDYPSPTVLDNGISQSGRNLVEAETDISKYAIGAEWDTMKQGSNHPQYLNLKKTALDEPSFCVSQMGGQKGVASVTHPTEKRKFSIAELKRICAFPDDFILTGSYAQQWERLGRAVPPVMMGHIARVIRDEVLSKCAG